MNIFMKSLGDKNLLALVIGSGVFVCILGVLILISYAKIFKKAGKPGIAAIIPIYNIVVMLQIAEMKMINLLFMFIPILQIIIMFKLYINIAKKFGKSTAFGVGMVLLGIIFIPLLAFSDDTLVGGQTVSNNNDLDNQNMAMNNNVVANNEQTVAPVENIAVQPQMEQAPAAPEQNLFDSAPVINPVPMEQTPAVPEQNLFDSAPAMDAAPIEQAPTAPEQNAFDNAPVMDAAPIEQTPAVPEQNAFDSVPVMDAAPIEQAPVVPEQNAFDSAPVMDAAPIEQAPAVPEQNAFDSAPVMDAAPIEQAPVIEPAPMEQTPLAPETNVASDKKICKNCGAEMPNIVTICPKCGTENE